MGVKYPVNEEFFETWSAPMAYTLGFWFADGSLEDASYLRGKYVRISSTDKAIIYAIRSLLESGHSVVRLPRPGQKTRYLLRIGSHKLFESLYRKGVTTRKSLTMSFPAVPPKFFWDFVRGYFDGDGCVHIEKKKKLVRVIFTSGSRRFLERLSQELSQRIKDVYQRIYVGRRSYQLRYPHRKSLQILAEMYHNRGAAPYLKRKFLIYQGFPALKQRGHVVK